MNRTSIISRSAVVVLLVAGLACSADIPPTVPPSMSLDARPRQAIGPWGAIPILAMPKQDPDLVELGRALFFDPILSGNRDVSCATCHHPSTHAGDGLSLAIGTGATGEGIARQPGEGRSFLPRHSPSLLNSGLGTFYALWDGRVNGRGAFGDVPGFFQSPAGGLLPSGLTNIVAAQAMFPVANRAEMRGQPGDLDINGAENELALIPDDDWPAIWRAVMHRVMSVPEYVAMFEAAYPGISRSGFTFREAANAIAAFQLEELTRVDTPFDRYLRRDDFALSTQEKEGALLFFGEARCANCHSGPLLGSQQFANAGVPQIGPGMSSQPPLDLGRGEMEEHPFYDFAFRVAPLRNVELTAPYMHNGAYATLEAVIDHYDDVPTALREYDVSQLDPSLRASHHGDEAAISAILERLDHRLSQPLELTVAEKQKLIAFLKALTDPSARSLAGIAPTSVPSGLPMRE